MKKVIEIKALRKAFGDTKAVDDISFEVREGELFAFLGVNGAGKSTTINIISGVLKKDSGEVTVNGFDAERDADMIKSTLGIVFQSSLLDSSLSVKDNLENRASLYGIVGKAFEKRLHELEELLLLTPLLKRSVGKLSGGERRRVDIARALLHRPKILILDEPTTGLDPQTRKLIWQVIDKMRKSEGMTVFLTTHYMEEASDADFVVILDSGRVSAKGTPHDLKNAYTGDFITLYNASEEKVSALGVPYNKIGKSLRVEVKDTKEARDLIIAHPDTFVDFEITKGKMDDVFLAVTGKKLEGEEK